MKHVIPLLSLLVLVAAVRADEPLAVVDDDVSIPPRESREFNENSFEKEIICV